MSVGMCAVFGRCIKLSFVVLYQQCFLICDPQLTTKMSFDRKSLRALSVRTAVRLHSGIPLPADVSVKDPTLNQVIIPLM